jgi:hypothetical protein
MNRQSHRDDRPSLRTSAPRNADHAARFHMDLTSVSGGCRKP